MNRYLLLLLILLPAFGQAQGNWLKKRAYSLKNLVAGRQSPGKDKDSVFAYTETRRLDTGLFFPRPPDIGGLRDTTSRTPQFTVRACLTNVKSLNDVRLTVTGDVQLLPAQTSTESGTCKGLAYSCAITLPLPTNTISLEARNEGGASVHYAVVTVKP